MEHFQTVDTDVMYCSIPQLQLRAVVEVAAVASEPEHRAAAVCWWCQQVGGHQTPDIWTVSLSACLQTFVNHKTSEE